MSLSYLRLLKVSILWSEISPVLDWSTMLKIESTGLEANRYSTNWATCPCHAGDPRQEVRGLSLAPPPETALKRRKMSWKQLTSEMFAQTFIQRRLRDQLRGLLRWSPRTEKTPLDQEESCVWGLVEAVQMRAVLSRTQPHVAVTHLKCHSSTL